MKLLLILLFLLMIVLLLQQYFGKALIGQKKKYSIGLYEGRTPFELKPSPKVQNPILTKFDVTDVRASFVADPFIVKEGEKYYLFIEVKSKRKRDLGEIAVASGESLAGLKYDRIVLREDFHLSFPNVFKVEDKWYMVPESGADRSVRLYETGTFPYGWKLKTKLLEGKNYADPVLFHYDSLWWLLVSDEESKSLEIWFSERFDGGFRQHPLSPLYRGEKDRYRNAGKILFYQNRLYRFSQDCSRYYGEKVDAWEITTLTPERFEEKRIKTVLRPSGHGWNAKQMHQVDYHEENGTFYAVVDGGSDEKENYYLINRFLRRLFR